MTAEELIKELQKYPKDAVVKIVDTGCTNCNPYGYSTTDDIFRIEYYPSDNNEFAVHIT